MNYRLLLLLLNVLLFAQCTTYDIIIQNGRVYDGTLTESKSLNIAVKGDKIKKIKPEINRRANRIIDAENLAVAPGFIDVHAHLEPLPLMPDAESHIRQGVTTALGGPDSGSPLSIGAYLDTLAVDGIGMNVAYLIGHNTVRNHVMGLVNRPPSSAELDTLLAPHMPNNQ